MLLYQGTGMSAGPSPNNARSHASPHWEKIAAYMFGVLFVKTLLVLAIAFPQPTPFQYTVFRIVLALAGGGVAAVIPGFLAVSMDAKGLVIRAGGALAVFLLLYFFNPAQLLVFTSSVDVDAIVRVLEEKHRTQLILYEGQLASSKAQEAYYREQNKPTVCLEVMSVMTSSCGYNRGESKPRVAQ